MSDKLDATPVFVVNPKGSAGITEQRVNEIVDNKLIYYITKAAVGMEIEAEINSREKVNGIYVAEQVIDVDVEDEDILNISEILTDPSNVLVNSKGLTFISSGTGMNAVAKFPIYDDYVDYLLELRVDGTFSSSSSPRSLEFKISRADDTLISNAILTKTNDRALRDNIHISTYTLNDLDPFIIEGAKLVIANNSGSRFRVSKIRAVLKISKESL